MNAKWTCALGATLALGCGGGRATSPEAGAPDAGPSGSSVGTPSTALPPSGSPRSSPPRANLVPAENALSGAADWRLHQPSALHEIEGYALAQSALPGDAVPIAVSLKQPMAFSWFAYRLGYYAGAGARELARGGPVQGAAQPACPMDRTTGLVTCSWRPSFQLATAGWPGGLYALKLVRDDGFDTWVPLVLRDPNPPSQVLLIVPTATWQA